MADNLFKADDLRSITNNLIDDTSKISDLYTGTISKAIENCKNDLQVAGLNYDEIQKAFSVLFANLAEKLTELTNAMNNSIIPKYEQTTSLIAKIFNQDFVNEINQYLDIIKS